MLGASPLAPRLFPSLSLGLSCRERGASAGPALHSSASLVVPQVSLVLALAPSSGPAVGRCLAKGQSRCPPASSLGLRLGRDGFGLLSGAAGSCGLHCGFVIVGVEQSKRRFASVSQS